MWIIYPKDSLLRISNDSDNENIILLLDVYRVNGGDYFGIYYSGKALINASKEFLDSMRSAQEEWTKIAYLSHLMNEYSPELFESVNSEIGNFELNAQFFDKYWNLACSEDVINVDDMTTYSTCIKNKIQISNNKLLDSWLSKIKNAT